MYVHTSQKHVLNEKNKSCRVVVVFELQKVRVFINRVMQTASGLLNQFISYMFLMAQSHRPADEVPMSQRCDFHLTRPNTGRTPAGHSWSLLLKSALMADR